MSPAHEFFHSLWEGKPDECHILVWSLPGKHSAWFTSIDDAASCAMRVGESGDVYVGAGVAPTDYGPDRRCPGDEIAGIAGLWADIDIASPAHSGKALPGSRAEALSLLPSWIRPTYVVATGNGVHIWLLFREPWMFSNQEERQSAALLELRFQTMLQLRAKERGWQFERLADLSRILRIPGTRNFKSPDQPRPVEVVSNSGPRWNPSELIELLDEMQIPDSEGGGRPPNKDWSFIVNPEAAPPLTLIDNLLMADRTFRSTWEGTRRNLADSSPSGYELALANIGVMAGMDDQTIVNLMIAWRQKHGHPPKLRPDYFARTLLKARSAMAVPSQTAPDAEAVSDCLKRLRDALPLPLAHVYKTGGDDPVYRFVLDDGRSMEVPGDVVFAQHRFAVAVFERFDRTIAVRREAAWRSVIGLIPQALEPLDRGPDVTVLGRIGQWLMTYLAETPFQTEPLDKVSGQERFYPIIREERVGVSSSHLRLYVINHFREPVSIRDLTAMLAEAGAKPHRERIGRNSEQGRWLLPQAVYPPEIYIHTRREKKDD